MLLLFCDTGISIEVVCRAARGTRWPGKTKLVKKVAKKLIKKARKAAKKEKKKEEKLNAELKDTEVENTDLENTEDGVRVAPSPFSP